MTARTRLIAALLGGAAIMVLAGVWFVMVRANDDGTSWPPAQRAAFIRSCVEKCRLAPGVTEDRYPLCDTTCACAADEGEKIMTTRELTSAGLAMANGQVSAEQTAKVERLKAAGQSCAVRPATDKK